MTLDDITESGKSLKHLPKVQLSKIKPVKTTNFSFFLNELLSYLEIVDWRTWLGEPSRLEQRPGESLDSRSWTRFQQK